MPVKTKRKKIRAGVPGGPKPNSDDIYNRNINEGPDQNELSYRFGQDRFPEEAYNVSMSSMREARFRPHGPPSPPSLPGLPNARKSPSPEPKGLGKRNDIQEESLQKRSKRNRSVSPKPKKTQKSVSPKPNKTKKHTNNGGTPPPNGPRYVEYTPQQYMQIKIADNEIMPRGPQYIPGRVRQPIGLGKQDNIHEESLSIRSKWPSVSPKRKKSPSPPRPSKKTKSGRAK